MSKPDVTFVNDVSVSGFLNGNVNLSLTQFVWVAVVPDEGKPVVKLEGNTVVDLRMDLYCAQQIRDALDAIIQKHTKPATEELN